MTKAEYMEKLQVFLREHVLGKEQSFDNLEQAIPNSTFGEFHKAGLNGWWMPKKYGGLGFSMEDSVHIVEELAYADAGLAFSFFISILCTTVVDMYGTEEQRKRFLGDFVRKGSYAGMMGSEKEAGSELFNIATLAKKSGDGYIVNGTKYFCTNCEFGDFTILITSFPEDPVGFKAFIVPKGTEGVKILRRWAVNGVRASGQYEVEINDLKLPSSLAMEPNGVRLLEIGLNFSRVLIAVTAIGIGRRVRDISLDYSKAKRVRNNPLFQNSVFAAKLGQIEADLDAMRTICLASSRDLDNIMNSSDPAGIFLKAGTVKSALVAKLLCGQIGWKIASMGSEMFGGLGYTADSLAGKLLRDVRYVAVVEGGEDVARDLIFSRYVKTRIQLK